MKHTPGPWIYDKDSGELYGVGSPERRHAHLVGAFHCGRLDDSNDARPLAIDAQLIAAAPELLEALKTMSKLIVNTFGGGYDIHGCKRPWLQSAEDAIAKAEGEESI